MNSSRTKPGFYLVRRAGRCLVEGHSGVVLRGSRPTEKHECQQAGSTEPDASRLSSLGLFRFLVLAAGGPDDDHLLPHQRTCSAGPVDERSAYLVIPAGKAPKFHHD